MKRNAVVTACRPLFEALETRSMMSVVPVANLNDSGAGSLRAAVTNANAGDTIDLGGLTGTITLSSEITINKDLTIAGPGSADLTISGDHHATRAFAIDSGRTVVMEDFTIDNAGTSGASGGAIDVDGADRTHPGTLTLTNMVLSNNLATGNGGAVAVRNSDIVISGTRFQNNSVVYGGNYFEAGGGAVSVKFGGLTAVDSTFDGNTVAAVSDGTPPGGPAARGGAIELTANTNYYDIPHGVTITNCTVVHNSVDTTGPQAGQSVGGGIFVAADRNELLLTNNTITANTATSDSPGYASAGGVSLFHLTANDGAFRFVNNIVYGNVSGRHADVELAGIGGWTSANNLIGADYNNAGSSTSVLNGVNGNITGVDPLLGTLADNGGIVPTVELRAGSRAINGGTNTTAPAGDARGVSRDAATDIGAFEYVAVLPPLPPANTAPAFTSTPVATVAANAAYVYNVTATDADSNPLTIVIASTTVTGLTIVDHGDGTATLGGTSLLPENMAGTVDLVVSDGVDSVHQTFTLTGTAAIPPSPVTLVDGLLGVIGTANADAIHVWSPKDRPDTMRVAYNGRLYNFGRSLVTAVQVDGRAGDDLLIANGDLSAAVDGGDGNDTLIGGSADDRLNGDAGNDSLDGGLGSDVLHGGLGRDVFVAYDGMRDRVFADDTSGLDRVNGDTFDLLYDGVINGVVLV